MINLNRKITSNRTKYLLVENQLRKLETQNYFFGKSHFEDDGTQSWLVFKPMQKYFNAVSANNSNILSWNIKDCLMKVLSP